MVDLERYPLHDVACTGYLALVEQCRNDLAKSGMFSLEGFLAPSTISGALAHAAPVMDTAAFEHKRDHNVYFEAGVPGLETNHPALRRFKTVNHTICADQIPENDLVKLYDWPPLREFLAAVMDKQALFPMSDRIACMNVMSYYHGEALNWHFDRSEFTVTLLLQAAVQGGHFEYRRDLRSDSDPNYQGVSRLIDGDDERVQQLKLSPGTLNVFRGKNTLHRVTPVEGDRPRIIAVFSYYEREGVCFTDEERMGFYGRRA